MTLVEGGGLTEAAAPGSPIPVAMDIKVVHAEDAMKSEAEVVDDLDLMMTIKMMSIFMMKIKMEIMFKRKMMMEIRMRMRMEMRMRMRMKMRMMRK